MKKKEKNNCEQNDLGNMKINSLVSEPQNHEKIWSYEDEREYRKWICSHMSEYSIEPFFEDMIYGE